MPQSTPVHRLRRPISAVVIIAALAAWVQADQPTPTTTDAAVEESPRQMAEEIRQLRARLAAVEAQLHQPTTEEVSITMAAVRADAERRSQLIEDGQVTAGHDGQGFFIRSTDGNFVLRPVLNLQVRYSTNYRQDFSPSAGDDTQS